MNYLSHLFLAEQITQDAEEILGNLMGDFVKGRLAEQYSPAVMRGLELHRQVDAYTDHHPQVFL